jgi:hypothetical protein
MKAILKIILPALLLHLSFFAKAQHKNLFDTSVLKLPKPQLTQIGNYNHFDIYQSTPDNMIVIKPDSTVCFTMPNTVKSFIIQTPVIKPKGK